MGFIFQDVRLLDALTIEENIALPLTIKGVESQELIQKTKKISMFLGIQDVLKKFPYEVSGGQRQRAAIARAIVSNPKILLSDEPTGLFYPRGFYVKRNVENILQGICW